MKKSKDVWVAAAGVLLMMVGAGLLGRIEPLAYVCIGLGAGLFGQGTGELVSRWALRNSPEIRKQLEIAQILGDLSNLPDNMLDQLAKVAQLTQEEA